MNAELKKYLKEGGSLGSLAKRPKKRAATAGMIMLHSISASERKPAAKMRRLRL